MAQRHSRYGFILFTPGERKKAVVRTATSVSLLLVGLFLAVAGCSGGKKGGEPEKDGEGDRKTPATSSASLDLVPADAPGFATIGLARWWNSEHGKRLQQQLAQLDPAAEVEKFIGTPPDQAERVTFVLPGRDDPCIIVTTTDPYDRNKVLARLGAGAEGRKVSGRPVHAARDGNSVCLFDARTYIWGPQRSVKALLDRPAQGGDRTKGPLAPALALADKHLLVVGVNPHFPELQRLRQEKGNPALSALLPLLDATGGHLTLDLSDELKLNAEMKYADEKAAQNGLAGVKAGILLAQAGLATLRKEVPPNYVEALRPTFNFAEALLRTATTEQQQGNVRLAVQSEKASLEQFMAALGPAILKVREAAKRTTSANNLRQIGLAMHNYHDANRGLPPAAIYSRDGQQRPLLSWRVAILPYIEQSNLYRQFKLDEPWDSPNNIKLLAHMPKTYEPVAGTAEPNCTFYRVFTGKNTLFPRGRSLGLFAIPDGTSNTILAVEAGKAVPWTKPDELVYNPAGPLPPLGGMFKDGFNVVMADGSVRFVKQTVSEKTLRAAITPAGGEILGPDW